MNLTAAVMLSAGVLLLVWAIKKINPGAILLSAFTGLAALFAADLVLGFSHLNLPINAATVLSAVLGGVPGVILITFLNALLGV